MRPSKSFKKRLVGFVAFVFCIFSVSGCNEREEVKKWIESTNQLRTKAIVQSQARPYRAEQNQALKEYFKSLTDVALKLRNDPKFAERFNSVAAKTDLNEVCKSALIAYDSEWQVMMKNCTRNNFFLCAEEVRAYPDIVASIRSSLNSELQKEFDKTGTCRRSQVEAVEK